MQYVQPYCANLQIIDITSIIQFYLSNVGTQKVFLQCLMECFDFRTAGQHCLFIDREV